MTEILTNTEILIEAVNKADSADGLLEAVEDLAAVKAVEAIPTLVEVLGYNNPGAAVAAVDGLIEIGEPVVPYLLANLDDYNYGARAWALRVFAGVGDPLALDLLLKAATADFSQSVRRAAARGLGIIRWSKLAPEKLLPAQKEVLQALLLTSEDGEWVVRYAAVVGLESLAKTLAKTQSQLVPDITARFSGIIATDTEIVVRARTKLAWQKVTSNE
ncbi:MAG: HEAT repeat domain-containing protein [Xenococcaceae cyanobacterium MO_188.B29]|nr:HEAT repeat domain-containing protein [Xenococcaceae cyanobacterium MO_188.B29]